MDLKLLSRLKALALALCLVAPAAWAASPPVAVPDNYNVNEDATLSVSAPGVLANDSDPNGNSFTASLIATTTNGTLTLNSNGSFTYRPSTNFFGTDTFRYRARESSTLQSSTVSVTITVNPVNDAPHAVNDSYSVNAGSTITVTSPGVLANDNDVDGDTINALLNSTVAHGSLTLNANGSFTYTPVASYYGSDSFTYRDRDAQSTSAVATVSLTVQPLPVVVAVPPKSQTNCLGGTAVFSVTATGTAIQYQWLKGSTLLAGETNSTLTLPNLVSGDAGTYSVRVTGAANAVTNSATLSLNVPVTATPLTNFTRFVGSIASFTTKVTAGTGPFSFWWLKNGAVIPSQTSSDLVLSNLTTADSATYSVVIGGACGKVTNSASLLVATCFPAVDVMLVIDRSGSMLGRPYTDARTACTNFVRNLQFGPTNDTCGLVAYNTNSILQSRLTNSASSLELAIHTLPPAQNGTRITYGLTNAMAELFSSRHRSNALPIIVLLSDGLPNSGDSPSNVLYHAQIAKNAGARIFTVGLGDVDPDLMANAASSTNDYFFTTNSSQLAAFFDAISTIICRPPTNIIGPTSLTICSGENAGFTVMASGCEGFKYQWRHDGVDIFGQTNTTYTVTNAQSADAGLYSVVVSAPCRTVTNSATLTVNTPAVITVPPVSQVSFRGSNVVFAVTATGTGLSYEWRKDGLLLGTSATLLVDNITTNSAGTYCVSVSGAFCGGTVSNCATLIVSNRAPTAVDESYITAEDTVLVIDPPGVLANDSDPDGDTLTAQLITPPTHGSVILNPNGGFSYAPNPNYNGPDSFVYRANDGDSNSNPATVSILVTPVNDPPVASDDAYSTAEDTTLTIPAPGILANDSDLDGDFLSAILVANVAHGVLNLDNNGAFLYTPSLNYTGVDTFTYRATDGFLNSGVATVTITVLPLNDPPAAVDDAYTINEDTFLSITRPGILVNDSDVDGDILSAVLVTDVTHGTLTFNTNGSFFYTPALNYNGIDTFTYRAFDGALTSGVATVTITINPTNDAPVAITDDAYTTLEDTTLTILAPGILANDIDVDGDALTALLVSPTTHGTLNLSTNGAFVYTPSLNYTGVDIFTYRATDGALTSGVATVTITVLPLNDPPVAVDDAYTINEDTFLSITRPGILVNDSDVDGNVLSAVLVTDVTHGTLLFSANGSFFYTPALNYHGIDTFTYRATDGALTSGVATVTITINPTNDVPVALNDANTTAEDTPLTILVPGVLGNDSDVDGDPLSPVLVSGVSHGTLSLSNNGAFYYTPSLNYTGVDTFTYRATDGMLTSGVATVTITVTPVNDIPVALNDSYTTAEDTPLTILAPGVLANDSDVDGDPLSSVLVSGVSHGTLSLSNNGAFVYTPSLNYTGLDVFTYRATDGMLTSGVATVTITVTPVNDVPVALNDAYTTEEDTKLTILAPGILANDSDVDGDPLSAVLVSGVSHGTLSLSNNGAFVYTPSLNYTGLDVFTYRATDGALTSGVATVTITVLPVNDTPVPVNDFYSINEDTTLTVVAPGILANDFDVDGDPLTAVMSANVQHGTLNLSTNGAFVYTPSLNYTGMDTFTYRVSDGTAISSIGVVTILVLPVNDEPVASNDTYTTVEDTTLTIVAPGVLANDSDVDGDPLSSVLVSGVSHGTLDLISYGAFVYTPSLNYTGVDTFTYRATDGMLTSAVATVTITVTPVNDVPVALNDAYTTAEDTPLTISSPGVLANDSDVDGDPLSAVLVSGVTHGTLSLSNNGAFYYTPSLNYTGLDVFTYRATDGVLTSAVATVTITVTPVNDTPIALNDAYTTVEDTPLTILPPGVLGNDSDVDGDPLSSVLVSGVSHGTLSLSNNGAFYYTPSLNYTGLDVFTYRTTDGALTSGVATVTITVTPVNDAPVALNDAYTTAEDTTLTILAPGVLANDSDVDGDPLSAVLVSGVTHGTLSLSNNGAFYYTPSLNYTGLDVFTYRATDGMLTSGVVTVTITVTPVNDVPVALNDSYTTAEDTPLTILVPGVLGNDSDVDGDLLSAVLVSGVTHGTLSLSNNGAFYYTPSLNYTGLDVFTYRATDGALTSSVATVTITVTPVNDAPVALNDSYTTVEDTPLTILAPGVLSNDNDVDGDSLSSVLVSGVSHGTLSLSNNGAFYYTPSLNYTGVDTFTYRATDGMLTSGVATVTITITPVNDAPVAVADDFYVTLEDTTLTIPAPGILANDIDVDGDPLTSLLVSNVLHGTLSLSNNGAFVYTPSLNYTGLDTFVYRATDGSRTSGVAVVTITVLPVNDAPVVVADDFYTTLEDTTLTVAAPGILANDIDVDGDPLTSLLVTGVQHGTLNLSTNGAFVYTPSLNYTGVDTFTYRATDGMLTSGVATVTITVIPVNDPPTTGVAGDSYSVLEDHTLTVPAAGVLANDADVDGDPLTALLVTGAAHGTVALSTNGSFVYTPATDYFGPDSFTYVAFDGLTSSAPATVGIMVIPVNDAPSFSNIGGQKVNQNAPAQSVNWASNISAGPANESNQLLMFLVSNDNNSLFSIQPAIAPNGTLTYTPAPNTYGTANVHVKLQDNGGTANGGVDTSAEVIFSIVVNSPPSISIVSLPDGTGLLFPATFSVISSASDPDGVVTNVQFLLNDTNFVRVAEAPFYFVMSNTVPGTYKFRAIATDNCGLSATSAVVNVDVLTNFVVATGPIVLNTQIGLFEQFVTVSNLTTETWASGVRLFVRNISAPNRVWNATGTNAGVPYIDKMASVPPGGFVSYTVQYYVPDTRTLPDPTLVATPRPFSTPTLAPHITRIRRAGDGFEVLFTTQSERFYFVQYSEDLVRWTTHPVPIAGTGGIVVSPQPNDRAHRFVRVLVVP